MALSQRALKIRIWCFHVIQAIYGRVPAAVSNPSKYYLIQSGGGLVLDGPNFCWWRKLVFAQDLSP